MQARKMVSILFCDVVDSTPLGEQLDPESLQRVMSRWFAEARTIVERHGGTVEKFIGDEVMAVFGVPVVHEDDALRAVRSAAALRDRLETLNDEFDDLFGVRLAIRIGVNTGEVVVGDPSSGGTFVTGEPVNLAKRLEQAADPGQILIGKATYPLVENAVAAGPLEAFRVKGKREAVTPWRIEQVHAGTEGVARRLDAPLVGRAGELDRLLAAFDHVAARRQCRLVTVLGPAGIGKTRLAEEARTRLGSRARTLTGRCLPYGDGITFWPLVEVLRALGSDGLEIALSGAEDREAVAHRLHGVTGASDVGAVDELFWAARRLVETLAAERPLVLVIEDLDRGEPTFLDLLDYLHSRIDDAPVLLLCLARPELLDRRPSWSAPRERTEIVVLEPLTEHDAQELLAGLGAELDEIARERVLRSAEGNPLYVEQLAALAETGELVVPPTIQALLAERLDRLDDGERAILERAAIIGQEFGRRAVTDLCPPELRGAVGRHLLALVRKELIRPHSSATSTEDAFRFRHALIRDVAYDGMPKEGRALFHEWFADWLERNAGERATELEEIVGYHLEQAVRLRGELGPADERARRLAWRGTERLGPAGSRALTRGDIPAAVNLLERAAALADTAETPAPSVLLELGEALRQRGDAARADELLARVAVEAERAGDELTGLRVQVDRAALRLYLDPSVGAGSVLEVAEQVTPLFEARDDQLGLCRAWVLVAEAHWMRSQYAAMERVLDRALVYAERAGNRRQVSWILSAMCRVAVVGPRPVADGVRRCLEIRERSEGDLPTQSVIEAMLAVLAAMGEQATQAREHYRRSDDLLEDLGMNVQLASRQMYAGMVELILGDAEAAERELRPAYEALDRMGELSYLSTTAALLARAVAEQGRTAEAEELTLASEVAASDDDLVSQVLWRATRANALASRCDPDAEPLAREAVRLAEQTDFVNMQADSHVALAETLAALGRPEEAAECLEAAISLYDTKGNVASSRRTAALALTASA